MDKKQETVGSHNEAMGTSDEGKIKIFQYAQDKVNNQVMIDLVRSIQQWMIQQMEEMVKLRQAQQVVEGKLDQLTDKVEELIDGMDSLKIQVNKSSEVETWDDEPASPAVIRKVEIVNKSKPTPVFTIPKTIMRYQANRYAEKGKSRSLKGACAYCNKPGHHIEHCWKLQDKNKSRN